MRGIVGFLVGVGLGAAASAMWKAHASQSHPPKNTQQADREDPDIVDLASELSFPASDAPAY